MGIQIVSRKDKDHLDKQQNKGVRTEIMNELESVESLHFIGVNFDQKEGNFTWNDGDFFYLSVFIHTLRLCSRSYFWLAH